MLQQRAMCWGEHIYTSQSALALCGHDNVCLGQQGLWRAQCCATFSLVWFCLPLQLRLNLWKPILGAVQRWYTKSIRRSLRFMKGKSGFQIDEILFKSEHDFNIGNHGCDSFWPMSRGLDPVTSGLHVELMLRIHSQTHIGCLGCMLSHIHTDVCTYIRSTYIQTQCIHTKLWQGLLCKSGTVRLTSNNQNSYSNDSPIKTI